VHALDDVFTADAGRQVEQNVFGDHGALRR
jgi:hypothetical protein